MFIPLVLFCFADFELNNNDDDKHNMSCVYLCPP